MLFNLELHKQMLCIFLEATRVRDEFIACDNLIPGTLVDTAEHVP